MMVLVPLISHLNFLVYYEEDLISATRDSLVPSPIPQDVVFSMTITIKKAHGPKIPPQKD